MAIYHQTYETEFYNLLYGALFHDIGKFYQRTRNKEDKKRITAKYKWYIDQLGRDYISHEEWSAEFLSSTFKNEQAEIIALKHHHPETRLQYLVAIADRLSAAEREDNTNDADDVARIPLHSILASIQGIRNISVEYKPSYKKICFNPFADPYPVDKPEEAISERDYDSWWEQFVSEIDQVLAKESTENKRFYQIYSLLQEYTQTIPSAAYYSQPTISLLDHSKTTAAIASALYRQQIPDDTLENIYRKLWTTGSSLEDIEVLMLLSGDISGIQDFVFNSTTKSAAKGLRGRSFYLSVLCDAIANYILAQERLTPVNILYSGGGHFYLILPASARERIKEYKEYIDRILYRAHRGKLGVVLAGTTLSVRDFQPARFGSKWKEVGSLLQKEKNRKFIEMIHTDPELILGPHYEGSEVCVLCGSQAPEGKCEFCASFEDLGDDIARQHLYLLEEFFPPYVPEAMTTFDEVLAGFGYRIKFTDSPPAGYSSIVSSINKKDPFADRPYLIANTTPFNQDGSIVTFEELAARSIGDKMWGVLRGDVDNLGRIFAEGFGNQHSISKAVALSREISLFFTIVFDRVCQQYKDSVYVIYSGGDDFFVVGSWSTLPVLAAEINAAFRRYCSYNPHVTLSCTVTIGPGITFPLLKVAETAGEELDGKAKTDREINGYVHSKDSICFLGHPFTWSELDEVKAIKDLIVKAIKDEGVSKALITHIYSAYTDNQLFMQQKYPLNRIWRMVYSFGRLISRHRKAEVTLKELENKIITSRLLLQENCVYAARWAEKEIRTWRGFE